VSGTYGYFKEHALCNGDFKSGVNEQPGSASVVQSVSSSLNGIGYSGIGYVTSGVRAVPLPRMARPSSRRPRQRHHRQVPAVALPVRLREQASEQAALPDGAGVCEDDALQGGQTIVAKDGYVPVPAKVVQADLKKLGIM
jgi:phosphate transport system substrate-binding protein